MKTQKIEVERLEAEHLERRVAPLAASSLSGPSGCRFVAAMDGVGAAN